MRTALLGEIADTVMGQAPPGKNCNKEGEGTVFVKAGEFHERFPVVREWTTKPLKFAESSDVLVCVVGATAGKVNQGIDCAIGRSVAAVRPRKETLDTGYLYYFLSQNTGFLRAKSQGLAQGVITRDMLHGLQIPLPPLEEQKRIATILDQADTLCHLRQQAIDRLNELGQAIFYEMFSDPATNPMGWPIGTIDDLTESTQYGTSSKAGAEGNFPILRMGNITTSGDFDLRDLKYIDLPDKDFEKYTVKDGDILFNRTNSPDLVGKTGVYRGQETYAYAGYLIRLRTNKNASPEYIGTYLNSAFGKKILRGMCKAIIGMANINAKELRTIPIPLVPIDLQNKFQKSIFNYRSAIPAFQEHRKSLETLFSSLQHRAFRGEL